MSVSIKISDGDLLKAIKDRFNITDEYFIDEDGQLYLYDPWGTPMKDPELDKDAYLGYQLISKAIRRS